MLNLPSVYGMYKKIHFFCCWIKNYMTVQLSNDVNPIVTMFLKLRDNTHVQQNNVIVNTSLWKVTFISRRPVNEFPRWT